MRATAPSKSESETEKSLTVLREASTWLSRDIILYRVKYVTAYLNLNPYDFSKFRFGEIAPYRAVDRLASRPDDVTHSRFCEASSDTVSRYVMRFIVFDSLNEYNFGMPLVGNTADETLSDARGIQVYQLARARPTYCGLWRTPRFLYAKVGGRN